MKKLYILTILLSFCFINIVSASDLKLNKELVYETNNIETIYSYSKEYIIIKNNTLYKYNASNKLMVSKEIADLANKQIIRYDKNFLLVGISANSLKAYLLDDNLQVQNQIETSEIIPFNTEFKLYNYDNKVYILLTNNNTLTNNDIIEIDNELSINKKQFSSYEPEILKEILKADYYLIHHNNEQVGDTFNQYNAAISYIDKNILIGSNSLDKAVLKIISGQEINETYDEYKEFKKIEIVNDKIYILTDRNVIVVDFTGKIIEEINTSNTVDLLRLSDKIAFISSDNKITLYDYDCNIEVIESDFGTISVNKTNKAFDKVKIDIASNSGFELDRIIVKDVENNEIKVENNEFTMPTYDVTIEAVYNTKIDNPETVDYIFIIVCLSALAMVFLAKAHKKLKWLK